MLESESENTRYKGEVEWFNEKRGFGLVKLDNKDIFIHHSEIKVPNDKFKFLAPNESIEFSIVTKNNKLCATNLTGINGEKLQCETTSQKKVNQQNKKKKTPKNTTTFEPCYEQPDIQIKAFSNKKKNKKCTENDVIVVNDLFCEEESLEIYDMLLEEIKKAKVDQDNLWKLWHGDTHLIADDHLNWKEECPIFNSVIEKIKLYFNMSVKATRFNYYKDTSQWKPFHHDAAAVKPHIAKKQNWTVGVSFGAERDAAFEHVKSNTVISIPQPNGSLYAFGNKVNMDWKHGIPQIHPDKQSNSGRISIIAWGWVDMN